MEHNVNFDSDGLSLSGILQVPDSLAPGERRPAVILLHGFGSHKGDGMVMLAARLLASQGYVTLRFDMRGCGDSEGEPARVICLEQVADTRHAVDFLLRRDDVAPDGIAVLGHSFGAAVAVYATGVDERIAACISSGGWGDGERKFRLQHASDAAWARFQDLLRTGRERRVRGQDLRVSRFDIVPIPEPLRASLPAGSFMEFPFEVVESMYDFRPNDVIAAIAPRPLLLLHPAVDSVTPTVQSIEMFGHARMPADLHLISSIDHFIFSDDSTLALNVVRDWLAKFLPVRQTPEAAAS